MKLGLTKGSADSGSKTLLCAVVSLELMLLSFIRQNIKKLLSRLLWSSIIALILIKSQIDQFLLNYGTSSKFHLMVAGI